MIESRGAAHAYAYTVAAMKLEDGRWAVYHGRAFDAADGDDEAYGRAMRIAHAVYPPSSGWSGHFAAAVRISGIESVPRHDPDKVVPFDDEGRRA
jgi:hypothetical protein